MKHDTEPGRDSLSRTDIMQRGTIWCCVGLLLGVVLGVAIRNFYL